MDFIRVGLKNGEATTGWKRAARVNSGILCAITLTLLSCFIAAAKQTNGLGKALMFYQGTCDGGSAAQVNVALHLLLNIVSTGIFASSNFFMQVLNSPSRNEIDGVHSNGSWMGIGVPSVRNAFRVSRFKTCCWILLLVSSIPLHLLFNSMLFQTDQRNSDFQLTIASDGFINHEQFYPPGASLIPGGWLKGWGTSNSDINLTQYEDMTSVAYRNISAIAVDGSHWNNISANDCFNEYFACSGLKSHRNVIAVVKRLNEWVRDEVWHLLPNQTVSWDSIVPPNDTNSLWFSAPCRMTAYSGSVGDNNGVVCKNTCMGALGLSVLDYQYNQLPKKTNDSAWVIDFFNEYLETVNHTTGDINSDSNWWNNNLTYGLVQDVANLTVNYCLAEPVDRVCHVGLSITLFLAVTACVFVKTITAIVVTIVLGHRDSAPLVTLGDAVASFIECPDPTTFGMCTIGQRDIRMHFKVSHRALLAGPSRWLAKQHRRYKIIPLSVWWSSYFLFGGAIAVMAYFLHGAVKGSGLTGQFLESDSNSFLGAISWTFAAAVLVANSPQLLLSFCYLTYNNLFTRLQMAKEWANYSSSYQPLRVTDPKGAQYSTYRLQLPYKYSIPLIICSIFLHWLLSNTIYVFISQGGYFNTSDFQSGSADSSLPDGTAIAVGYSVYALLTMLIVSVILICIPIALACQKLPAGSVSVGSNSIAISAACHVSPDSKVITRSQSPYKSGKKTVSSSSNGKSVGPKVASYSSYSSLLGDATYQYDSDTSVAGSISQHSTQNGGDRGIEMQNFSQQSSETGLSYSSQEMTKADVYKQIARSRVRWGVVRMPAEFYKELDNHGRPYEHLSFGVEEDEVRAPVYMRHYA